MFSAKVRERSNGRARQVHPLAVFLLALGALLIAGSKVWAVPLSAARIIIEINATDGDAGIQIFVDGEGWDFCEVTDPNGNVVLNVQASGSVGMQGITELFFESAEPSFDEQPLEALLELFPKGNYGFDCTTTEGQMLKGSAMLTHKLPAAPVVNAHVNAAVVIEWGPVTTGFPGSDPGVVIAGYEAIVERLKDGRKFTITLPPTVTSVTVPPEFIQSKTKYKVEVLAIEKSGNQTIRESGFATK